MDEKRIYEVDISQAVLPPTTRADLIEVGTAACYLHTVLDINLAVAWRAMLTLRAMETGRDYSPLLEIIPEWYIDSNFEEEDTTD